MSYALDEKQLRYIELQGVQETAPSQSLKNIITTSQYTKYNFLPKALLRQFMNLPKFWFLFITLIELAQLSQAYQLETLIPLIVLIIIEVTQEGLRDYNRHLQDEKINLKKYPVWIGNGFRTKLCKDLTVGDLVLIMNGEEVPADILILSVGNEEHQCYVDASEIIGESGLKVKAPVKETQNIIDTLDISHCGPLLNTLNDDLWICAPCKEFKVFTGKIKIIVNPASCKLDISNLLLRGMRTVNTPWLIGVVVYQGFETKMWLNYDFSLRKSSQLSNITEKWMQWGLLLILLISSVNTVVYSFFEIGLYKWYDVFLGNLMLFDYIVPISLVLVIELAKTFLNYLIHRREPNVILNAPELCSDLGMVEYIITDKSGTLTENKLKIAALVVNNKLYISNQDEINSESSQRYSPESQLNPEKDFFNYPGQLYSFKDLQDTVLNDASDSVSLHFFFCMALCNLAVPDDGEFLSISVDDKVLAEFASEYGFKAIARDEDTCLLEVFSEECVFYVLGTQAFSSDRKKSRIVVKKKGSNDVYMYSKGSKLAMQRIYAECHDNEDIDAAIMEYRSLYLGYKRLTKREVEQFLFEYSNAKLSLVNKEGRVESVFEKFEKNSEFLGIVGIEDYISEDSKATVKLLKQAGVKFWLLSGDWEDPTITSAFSSGIFESKNKILKLQNLTSDLDCLNYLESYIKKYVFPTLSPRVSDPEEKHGIRIIKSEMDLKSIFPIEPKRSSVRRSTLHNKIREKRRSSVHPVVSKLSLYKHLTSLEGGFNPSQLNFVLCIDSKGFEFCLETQIHLKYFMFLLFTARAVCFHSLLPDQKTKVIKLLKSNFRFRPVVLAIGDSVSDVGMIQEANVGVAIASSSAARSADVMIKKFSDLKHLLMIHGHKQYIQISKMVLMSLYAMALIEFQLAFFNIISQWTATPVMNSKRIVTFKLVASIIPVLGLGLLDKDQSSTKITPQAYKVGIFNSLLTVKNLVLYISIAAIQSVFTFLLVFFYFTSIRSKGSTENIILIDISVFIIIYITLVISVLVETYSISVKTIAASVVSLAIGVIIVVPLSYTEPDIVGVNEMLSETPEITLLILPVLLFNYFVSYLFKAMRFQFYPDILEKVRSESPNSSLENQTRLRQYTNSIQKVFRESVDINNKKKDYDASKLNNFTLKFSSDFLEKSYQADKVTESLRTFEILFAIVGVYFFIFGLFEILNILDNPSGIVYISISMFFFLLVSLLPRLKSFRYNLWIFIVLYYILIQVFLIVLHLAFNRYSLSMMAFSPFFILMIFSNHWFILTILVLLSSVIVMLNAVFTFINMPFSTTEIVTISVSYGIIYTTLCIVSSIISYHIDKSKRLEFLLVQNVQVEIQKSKSVLNYLLPAFVRRRVKDGVRFISENVGVVSIIFCDIENFESVLTGYKSQDLTILMDDLFRKLDIICSLSGCTKIETVGKTYMACAGLEESESELDKFYSGVSHARRCVEMAIAILRTSELITLNNGETLKFKIGINSGVVTAGVVGYHKPQFSLVGDTVNTASRMASLCPAANTIQITKETFDLIDNAVGLIFTSHTVIAKGKGEMHTYLVSSPTLPENSALTTTSKLNYTVSQSISELFSFKSSNPRSRKTRKTTLYQFSNQHADNDRRRSSIISILESEVSIHSEFLRRDTEVIEQVEWFTFRCRENTKEKSFRIEISETMFPTAYACCWMRALCNLLMLIMIIIELALLNELYRLYEFIRLIIETIAVLVIIRNLKARYSQLWFSWLTGLVFFIGAITKIGIDTSRVEVIFLDFVLHLVQAAHCSQLFFKHYVVAGSLCILAYIIFAPVSQFPGYPEHIISISVFFSILLYHIYQREKTLRYYWNIKNAAGKELKKTEELLKQMMPTHVLQTLREQNSVTEDIKDATILYADIVGFTKWASQKTPNEVVNMLYELFKRFDHKCVDYEVYKVHTIGDCYVAMGFREAGNRQEKKECYNMARFALELVKVIHEVNEENGIELNMRIGMHTGNIIGGITGTNIVRYDIYGLDVLIANKMESSGKEGMVKISQATMSILSHNYPNAFTYVKDLPITFQSKEIQTYYLFANELDEDP